MNKTTQVLRGLWRAGKPLLPVWMVKQIKSSVTGSLSWVDSVWSSTPFYKKFLQAETKRASEKVEKRLLSGDRNYVDYANAQLEKSLSRAIAVRWWSTRNGRTDYLAGNLKKFLNTSPSTAILCVGCRDRREIDFFEDTFVAKIVGLDLFSTDPRIVVGDMHKIPFPDASFDAVYSCHSLEHSYDADLALKEFFRVLKPGGLLTVEVPLNYPISKTDLVDFKTVDNMVKAMNPYLESVLWSEDTGKTGRIIVKKSGSSLN